MIDVLSYKRIFQQQGKVSVFLGVWRDVYVGKLTLKRLYHHDRQTGFTSSAWLIKILIVWGRRGDWQSWTLYQLHISGQQQRKLWSRNNTSTLTYQRCPMQIRVDSHLHSSHGAEQISNMKFCPLYMIKIYRNRQVFVGKHWWGCQTSIAYLTFHWKVFS